VTVSSGGVVDVYDAEVAGGATLSLTRGTVGDDIYVAPGGVVKGPGALTGQTYVQGAIRGVSIEGQLELASGGTARDVIVAVDGSLQIDLGATDRGATALSGALINVIGSASRVVVGRKGEEYVNSGGVDSGAIIQAGGEALVYSGGLASRDLIRRGGLLLLDGGIAAGDRIQSGGTLAIEAQVTGKVTPGRVTRTTVVEGVTLASGAFVNVDSATVAKGGTVRLRPGTIVTGLDVDAGGAVVGPGVLAGFTTDAGLVRGATIGDPAKDAFGDIFVLSGGTLNCATIAGDGEAFLDSGAAASDLSVSHGGVVVGPGDLAGFNWIAGQLSGVTLAAGAEVELVSGGTASGVALANDRTPLQTDLEIDSGGAATGTEVGSNTREVIRFGGVASGTAVLSGGLEIVLIGGTTTGTQVSGGGAEIILWGGSTLGATVLNDGVEVIASGGVARDLSLRSGGVLVDNGLVRIGGAGTLAGTLEGWGAVVETGGGDLVLRDDGRRFAGEAEIEGGTIVLAASHALGWGYVEFVQPSTGSAVLQIDAADAPKAGGTFANWIADFSGFGEAIDLRSLAFVSGASAEVVCSTLVLRDGGATYRFDIAGVTAPAYSVTSDGHGGTLIRTTAVDPGVARFAQAAAAFAPPAAARVALVSSSTTGLTPFLHATASATAGHL
jgi:autotransporter passenger strand-loop-strand repeat protein